MRALFCLDPASDYAQAEEVARAAGLDAVAFNADAAGDDRVVEAATHGDLDQLVNVPLMFDPEHLRRHPESLGRTDLGRPTVTDWLWYACPSDETWWAQRLDTLDRRLARLRPALVSLDFARGFVFWERVPPPGTVRPEQIERGCCCARCEPPGVDPGRNARDRAELIARRVGEAARMVRRRHPGVPVGVKLVPWLGSDHDGGRLRIAAQDPALLAAHVDLLMPMSYAQLIGRPATFLRDLHRELRALTGKPLFPWLQADIPDSPREISIDDVEDMLDEFENDDLRDYCVFHFDSLKSRPDIVARLRSVSTA